MSNPENPELHEAVKNLLEAMRANEARAFEAGWNACCDQTRGFPEAWRQYVDQQEEMA